VLPPVRLCILVLATAMAVACSSRQELVIFHAPSLSKALVDVGDEYAQLHPDTRLRVEVSGSQVAARKLTELNLKADVIVLSDAEVIDRMLLPNTVDWNVRFATNEIIVAHAAHSRYTEEITPENWPEILSRGDVRLGLANPDTSPLGYRTLAVLELAAAAYERAGLAQQLRGRIAAEHVMADEAELWALLSSRAVDYAFLYRSTAEDHRLKVTALPDAINLSRPELDREYAKVAVPVVLKHGQPPVTMRGATIWYGVAVPRSAPNPTAGRAFVALLLSERGQRALKRAGFRPVVPAVSDQWPNLPPELKPLVTRGPGA
jgi:molybdate/tungstate transport system substrate-binding protein